MERYSIVLVSGTPELSDRVNAAVRASGVSIEVVQAATHREAKSLLADGSYDLIACEAGGSDADYGAIAAIRGDAEDAPPVIAVASRPGNSDPVAVLEAGLSGLAYVDLPGHLALVIRREIGIARALGRQHEITRTATSTRDEHARLFEDSGDALAVAESGILVRANPAWQELFGAARSGDGASILEFFDPADAGTLKKALRKHADTDLEAVALTEDGAIPVTLAMRRSDGGRDGPLLELAVRNRGGKRASLAELTLARRLDPETGLPARGSLLAILADRPQASLLVVRVDHFSRIVDRVGIGGSDAALRQLADILRDRLPGGGFAARIEGTAFGVLIEGEDHDAAEAWAKELCESVAKAICEHDGRSTTMSVSIGVRHGAGARKDPMDEAWQAVRAARKAGGGRVEVHADTEEKSQAELREIDTYWATRIKDAIKQGEFRLAYQQIADLDGARSDIYDVLLRLQDKKTGTDIKPGEFLPSAARSGLTVAIDRWVIVQALRVLGTDGNPGKGATLFVRLSDESIGDKGLAGWLKKQVEASPTRDGRLAMELSEAQADSRLKQVRDLSAALESLGCGLVLTNFGTGDQSMQLLEHLKLDFIKLDAPLIANLRKDEKKREATQEIIKFAKSRGVYSIASGIEDANTMALLWQLGIGYIQGHYVQEPEVIISGG